MKRSIFSLFICVAIFFMWGNCFCLNNSVNSVVKKNEGKIFNSANRYKVRFKYESKDKVNEYEKRLNFYIITKNILKANNIEDKELDRRLSLLFSSDCGENGVMIYFATDECFKKVKKVLEEKCKDVVISE